MNNDDLLKDMKDILSREKISSDSFTGIKDLGTSSDLDNSNNNIIEVDYPDNIFDVRDALELLRELEVNKKDFSNKDKINEVRSFLSSGIHLDKIPYHDDFIHDISAFLCSNGFSLDFVVDNLKDMEGHVLPVEYLYGGKAQALRSHIDLELDFFDYDEDGKVLGVSEDKKELYRHVVVHEFFHKLSSYKNGSKDVIVLGDALLEGFTDYFTKRVLNDTVESDMYGFPVKVCDLFTEMIGVDKVLDDYINNTGQFPNLKNLFEECGIDREGFIEFSTGLSSVISGVSRDKKTDLPKSEWGRDEKLSSLDYLRDNIVIPYCMNNPDKAEGILNKFNILFNDMGYSCSMDDVKTGQK